MGLVGEGAIVTSVLPDVFPVIDVEDMQTDGWLLGQWKLCVGHDTITDALLSVEVALENLAGSNMLVVIEQIDLAVSSSSLYLYGVNTAGTVDVGTDNGLRRIRDMRAPVTASALPTTHVTQGTAIPFSTIGRGRLLGNTTLHLKPPKGVAVLPPGSIFVMQNSTTNAATDVTYWWRERPIEPSEQFG